MSADACVYYTENCVSSSKEFAVRCVSNYCAAHNRNLEHFEIEKLCSGKPVLDPPFLHISLSHSRAHIACAVSSEPVGVDIEKIRQVDIKKIAERFFSKEETAYTINRGESAFFKLWTMKESYAKLMDIPLLRVLRTTNAVRGDELSGSIGKVVFEHLRFGDGFILCLAKEGLGFDLIALKESL